MREYEVTKACYVPVGPGFRWKVPGQRVRLSADDAAELGDLVVAIPDRVQIRNTLTAQVGSSGLVGVADALAETVEGVQELNTPPDVEAAVVDQLQQAGLEAGVQKLNTPKAKKAKADEPAEEVVDAGEPSAANERAAAENRE